MLLGVSGDANFNIPPQINLFICASGCVYIVLVGVFFLPLTGKKYPVPGQWKGFYFVLKFDEHKLLFYEHENVRMESSPTPSCASLGCGSDGLLSPPATFVWCHGC